MGGDIFRTCPDQPWGPPSLLYNGYRVKSGQGVTLTPHPLLVPWSRKSIAIPLLHLWAVRPLQSLSVCTTVHCTLPYNYNEHKYYPQVLPTIVSEQQTRGYIYRRQICATMQATILPYFSIDNAHLMYNAHPKLFRHSF